MGYGLSYSNMDELARLVTQIFLMLKMAGKIFERKRNGLTVTVSSEGWCVGVTGFLAKEFVY
jgi:hypothetical protein